jgi:hypothetical protein
MLLGFKKRFVKPVECGSKIHTFRNKRKVRPKVGETIHMYTGLRTKQCSKILGEYIFKSSQPIRMTIRLNDTGFILKLKIGDKHRWILEELETMAINDGFENLYCFVNYWTDGFNKRKVAFSGECIHWTDLTY